MQDLLDTFGYVHNTRGDEQYSGNFGQLATALNSFGFNLMVDVTRFVFGWLLDVKFARHFSDSLMSFADLFVFVAYSSPIGPLVNLISILRPLDPGI